MSDGTKIEWTDATWNIINGCTVVSPGCKHCYAMKQAHRFPIRQGLTQKTAGGMVWTGEVRFHEPFLEVPLRWKRPRRIFVCAHGDLFHEKVPDEWIDKVFAIMALAHWHTFQVLTKRPERMRAYCSEGFGRLADTIIRMRRERGDNSVVVPLPHIRPGAAWWPLPNVWLGTSVEDQQRAGERVPMLMTTPAAVRWLSCEPLLGPVNLEDVFPDVTASMNALTGEARHLLGMRQTAGKIDWVVVGGESGPGARPMHPAWARSLRDQCAQAGVSFLFKQWGDWAPGGDWPYLRDAALALKKGFATILPSGVHHGRGYPFSVNALGLEDIVRVGKKAAGRLLDGIQHDGFPA